MTFGVVFCAFAAPVTIGLVLLVALIPGCNNEWVAGVATGVLLTVSGWLLLWLLAEVGAQWDRMEEPR